MAVELDHLLWAAPDLDAGTAAIASLTGVEPARSGSHPGFGTRNSLLSLGQNYLEVIAPDPEQRLEGNRGGTIAALPHPGLITFAVRTTNLWAYADAATRIGLKPGVPVAMSRTRPDGVHLEWEVLHIDDPAFGGAIPFAIDWKNSPHPAASTPEGCTLTAFSVLHPDADKLSDIYRILGVPVRARRASHAGFLAELATPHGEAVLTSP